MVSRWCVVVMLSLLLLGCSGAEDEPAGGEQTEQSSTESEPTTQARTVEEYATASQEACDDYLGAMFEMAQQDEELDTGNEDAATDLFLRRADDIARMYADYRSSMESVAVPEDDELRDAHEEILNLMDQNLDTIRGVAAAQERGDEEEARALLEESSRIEDEIAAVQAAHGIRPCG